MKGKKLIVFILSIILIVFGIAGCTISLVFMNKINLFTGKIKQIDNINSSVKGGFESITAIAQNTSVATENMAASIKSARESLLAASKTADTSAEAIYSIAELTDFDILGVKPMADASEYFKIIGDNLKTLSASILETANSLQINEDDVLRIGINFKEVSIKLNAISTEINQTVSIISENSFIKLVNILTTYIVVLHLMFVIIGFSMILLIR
jgi:hypothetical protein